jgi:hypothetical protein
MYLRFVSRELKKLEQTQAEVLIAAVMEDEKPPKGVAGMVDWRLCGQLSRLIKQGYFKGALGEVLLLPTKPALPFDKALLFGCGPAAQFDERAYIAVLTQVFSVLEGLKAGNAVVELPGRHLDLIPPARAVDVLLELVGQRLGQSVWTLVDAPQTQQTLNERRLRERRNLPAQ